MTDKITVESNTVNINIPGIYEVIYNVVDVQGAFITKTIKVIVKQNLVEINQPLTIEMYRKEFVVGEEIKTLEYIRIQEDRNIFKMIVKVESTIPYEVKDGKEYFKTVGKYMITYTVIDELGASSTCTFDIVVKLKGQLGASITRAEIIAELNRIYIV